MTLNDLLKRVENEDRDKMIIYIDGKGWTNVDVQVSENMIMIVSDDNRIFSDDKN